MTEERLAQLEKKVDELGRMVRLLIVAAGRCPTCEQHVAGWHLRHTGLALPKEVNPSNGHLWTCEEQPR